MLGAALHASCAISQTEPCITMVWTCRRPSPCQGNLPCVLACSVISCYGPGGAMVTHDQDWARVGKRGSHPCHSGREGVPPHRMFQTCCRTVAQLAQKTHLVCATTVLSARNQVIDHVCAVHALCQPWAARTKGPENGHRAVSINSGCGGGTQFCNLALGSG